MAEVQVQVSKPAVKKSVSSSKTSKIDENTNPTRSVTESQSNNPFKVPAVVGTKDNSAITKEVLSILKEMNSHVSAQGTRLEKQEEKLESLFNQFNEIYYAEPSYEPYDESYDEFHDGTLCNEDAESSSPKGKTGVFKCLVDKFQQCETVDAEVNCDLAHFVNSSFRNGLPDDKLNDILKDIHRPENCESLVKTRVNQGIWRLLKMNSQADDNKMQAIQELLVKASSCIVKLADIGAEKFDGEDVDWITNAIALLGHVNKMINICRKETHKPDLDSKYHYLASSSLPYTEFLYGDDNDVNRNV